VHWADVYAGKLIERGKKHVIETGTSISGIPHVGNAGDIIRGDAVRKALSDAGVDVKLNGFQTTPTRSARLLKAWSR